MRWVTWAIKPFEPWLFLIWKMEELWGCFKEYLFFSVWRTGFRQSLRVVLVVTNPFGFPSSENSIICPHSWNSFATPFEHLKNIVTLPSDLPVSEEKSLSFKFLFPICICNASFLSGCFQDFVFLFSFHKYNFVRYWHHLVGIFCFEFTQLYYCVSLCLLPNLGNFQPLFLVICFHSHSLSTLLLRL